MASTNSACNSKQRKATVWRRARWSPRPYRWSRPVPDTDAGRAGEMGDGSVRYLSIGVRPSLPAARSSVVPAVQITPTPQAFYAYTAGRVADLTPGQAVTSLNGLTRRRQFAGRERHHPGHQRQHVDHQRATGRAFGSKHQNRFQGGESGRHLARLAALPIESWRYTNEIAWHPSRRPDGPGFQGGFRPGEQR